MRRISECLKQPEFRRLLNEYAEAMQSPEAKQEEEAYLRQLEEESAEGGARQLQILLPRPAFCVKCRTRDGAKVYINVCASDKIAVFTEDRSADSANALWHVPLSIGKPRTESDKRGRAAETFDAVFHPTTVRLADDSRRFMCFLIEICVEHINEGYHRTLTPEFKRMGKVASKGQPPAQSVRVTAADATATAGTLGTATGAPLTTIDLLPRRPPVPKPSAANTAQPSKPNPLPAPPDPTASPAVPIAAPPDAPAQPPSSPAWVQPDYDLVHRGDVSVSDAWVAREDLQRRLPRELLLRVKLPLMASASEADGLEVFEGRVVLRSAKWRYRLDVQLPFLVDDEKCAAKFDKHTRELTLRMPVKINAPSARHRQFLMDKAAERAEFTQEARAQAQAEAAAQEVDDVLQDPGQPHPPSPPQPPSFSKGESPGTTALEPRVENAFASDPPAAIEDSCDNKEGEKSAVIDSRPLAASTPAPTTHQIFPLAPGPPSAENDGEAQCLEARLELQREAERRERALEEAEALIPLRCRLLFEID